MSRPSLPFISYGCRDYVTIQVPGSLLGQLLQDSWHSAARIRKALKTCSDPGDVLLLEETLQECILWAETLRLQLRHQTQKYLDSKK